MTEKEKREQQKASREKLAGFVYDVSKLVLAGLVIGGVSPFFSNGSITSGTAAIMGFGTVTSLILAYFAYRIMNSQRF